MQAVLPTVIWRDVAAQHFATPKGEYDPAALGQQCRPLQNVTTPSAQQVHTGLFAVQVAS